MSTASSRSASKVNHIINAFFDRHHILVDDAPWEVRQSGLGGLGVFAKRDLYPGDIIFRDYPVIMGPRCLEESIDMCVNCYSKLDLAPCSKKCGLLLCSNCQASPTHKKECEFVRQRINVKMSHERTSHLTNSLTPLRSIFLSLEDKEVVLYLKAHKGHHHGFEVDILTDKLNCKMIQEEKEFLKFVCSVLDTNAFELVVRNGDDQTSVRGLYPLGSLANHRCFPNTLHVFDDKQRMVTRASVFIRKDEEIFHSYTKILWGTSTRLLHLKETKHFVCKCERCSDPTEFGTYMNAISCDRCKGNVIPIIPQKNCDWRCEDCMKIVSVKEVGKILTLIGSVLRSFRTCNFEVMYSFLRGKLSQMVPDSNQAVLELKYKIIWFLGYAPGFEWKELSLETLIMKKSFCRDILGILQKLNVGLCKIRGLLLYEMYLCSEEINKRKVNVIDKEEGDDYLKEASDILKFDVSAPLLIRAGRLDMERNGNES